MRISKTGVKRGFARLLQRRAPSRQPLQGLPPRLDYDLLNACVRRLWGTELRHVTHLHLSPLKDASGAYRLWCATADDRTRPLIFKDGHYGNYDAPWLGMLPVKVGHAEYSVYSSADESLRSILPEVYHCAALRPGHHYQYLLEDLAHSYRKPTRARDILYTVQRLPKLAKGIADWASLEAPTGLTSYDHNHCMALSDFAAATLGRYVDDCQHTSIASAWSEWPAIAVLMSNPRFHDMGLLTGIHGDLNTASAMVPQTHNGFLKVVDWEWAGLGIPHFDLVSLLDGASDGLVREALALYSEQSGHLDYRDHERVFYWSRVVMCIRHAAFLAAQLIDGQSETRIDRRTFIARQFAVAVDAAARCRTLQIP